MGGGGLCVWGGGRGPEGIQEISVPFSQVFYEPKTTLKI